MSLVRGSNSALSSSSFFFSSSSSRSRPSFVVLLSFFAIELLELLHGILIDGVHHVKNLEPLLAQGFKKGRSRDCSDALASDVINVIFGPPSC